MLLLSGGAETAMNTDGEHNSTPLPATTLSEKVWGLHLHFKGGWYFVTGLERNSDNGNADGAVRVCYVSDETGTQCSRKMGEFTEKVRWPDGEIRPRFVRVRNPWTALKWLTEPPPRGAMRLQGFTT